MHPVSAGVVVHIGDVMARWSNDLLHSAVHRVVPAAPQKGMVPPRYALVFVSGVSLLHVDEVFDIPLSSKTVHEARY